MRLPLGLKSVVSTLFYSALVCASLCDRDQLRRIQNNLKLSDPGRLTKYGIGILSSYSFREIGPFFSVFLSTGDFVNNLVSDN